ncbi:hypothetical protein PWR63_08335 [Paraburkholderia sp. A2WS-5]|uniref:hypothetical protein n=1 Tax=unclassified Paraburkholderia TaxID=2615204 RepID=UPI003B76EFA3
MNKTYRSVWSEQTKPRSPRPKPPRHTANLRAGSLSSPPVLLDSLQASLPQQPVLQR